MNEYTAFRLIEEPKFFHIPNPITSRLPEKSDKSNYLSSGILPTFEKPDQAICSLEERMAVFYIEFDCFYVLFNSSSLPFKSRVK